MPNRRPARSVELDVLEAIRRKGVESDVLTARIAYMELEGIRRYVADMAERDRIYPHMLPTAQAGGRWSTTDPPLTNWPRHDLHDCGLSHHEATWCPRDVRGVLLPDPGTYWLKWDWHAVEARLAATYVQDPEDLQAFANGFDIHTITACRMFGWDLPPVLTPALHVSPDCQPWRERYSWSGPEDARRHLAKTARYALLYAEDHHGILNAKGVEKLGYTRQQLETFGKSYLRAKPHFVLGKQSVQAECARTGIARSAFGRLRRLSGDARSRGKEGWSHTISATVSDMMNLCLIDTFRDIPEMWVIVNRHDGAEVGFPDRVPLDRSVPILRSHVEREWTFWGHPFTCPASWEQIRPTGEYARL